MSEQKFTNWHGNMKEEWTVENDGRLRLDQTHDITQLLEDNKNARKPFIIGYCQQDSILLHGDLYQNITLNFEI